MDLTKAAAYSDKTPYDLWRRRKRFLSSAVTASKISDSIPVAPWKRTGVFGSFVHLVGAGRTCSAYVCEIPPGGESKPQRYLFEQLIYVVKGRGATTVWNKLNQKTDLRVAGGQPVLAAAQRLASTLQCDGKRNDALRRADGRAADDQSLPQSGLHMRQRVFV